MRNRFRSLFDDAVSNPDHGVLIENEKYKLIYRCVNMELENIKLFSFIVQHNNC